MATADENDPRYPGSHSVDEWLNKRPAQQFPSKFSQLPGIGSPTPNADNQLMPFTGTGKGPLPAGPRTAWDGLEPEERLRQLETRVNVAERSNRALLEEVVRLQGELKAAARTNDEKLRDQRQAQSQLENTLRSSADLLAQMSTRLQRTEDKVSEERAAVTALMNHTKSVEQAVLGSQQEMLSRRDMQGSKLQDLRTELAEANRSKEQLERVTFQLVDEVRGIKSKLESELMDSKTNINDLKNKAKKLEDENRQTRMESMRKTGETQSASEQVTGQLRSQVEQRLGELRDVVVDLRAKTDQEVQDRRMLEQQVTLKLSDTSAALAEQNRRREEALHALEVMQREKEHAAETERIRLQSKIAEIAEEVSKKILQKEMKLREESTGKFAELEQALLAEQAARQAFERNSRENNEKQLDSMRKLQSDEIGAVREAQKLEKSKNNEKMHKLNEAVQLVESQLAEVKKGNDKVLAAEIKARNNKDKETRQRIDDLQDKLQVATSTLQQAIGGMTSQMQSQTDKMKRDMRRELEDNLAAEVRRMSDMDARITALNRKITSVEETLEAKLNTGKGLDEASSVLLKSLREKMDGVLDWQDQCNKNVKQTQKEVKDLSEDVYELETKNKVLKSDVDSRVKSEGEARNRDIEILKREMAMFGGGGEGGGGGGGGDVEIQRKLFRDIQECNQSIRRLAESIQTVKTVLGMKIQSEQKLRKEDIEDIEDDVRDLQHQIKPLLGLKLEPRMFIKPDDWHDPDVDNKDLENATASVNRWSIYNTYRFYHMKRNMMKNTLKSRGDITDTSSAATSRSTTAQSNYSRKSNKKVPESDDDKSTIKNSDSEDDSDDEKKVKNDAKNKESETETETEVDKKKKKDDSDTETETETDVPKKKKDDSDDESETETDVPKKKKDDSDDESETETDVPKKKKDDSDDETETETDAKKKKKDDSDDDDDDSETETEDNKKKPSADSDDSDDESDKNKKKKDVKKNNKKATSDSDSD